MTPRMHATLARLVAMLAALVMLLAGPRPSVAEDTPPITRPVTDLTGLVPKEEVATIERRLLDHHAVTHVQIAVLLVRSTNGEPIDDYAHRVATAWAGGRRGEDKGALVVLALDDRRSRIEVGYGLEAVLPDGKARAILDIAKPQLRSQAYGAAVASIVERVIDATGGAPATTTPADPPSNRSTGSDKAKRAPIDPASVPWTVRKVGWLAVALYVAALFLVSRSPLARRRTGVTDGTVSVQKPGEGKPARPRAFEPLGDVVLPALPFAVLPLLLPSAYRVPTSLFPVTGAVVALVALMLEARAEDHRKRRVRIVSRVAGSLFMPLFGLSLSGAVVPYPADVSGLGFGALVFGLIGGSLVGWLTSTYDPSRLSSTRREERYNRWPNSYSSGGSTGGGSGGGESYGGGGGSYGGGGASSDW